MSYKIYKRFYILIIYFVPKYKLNLNPYFNNVVIIVATLIQLILLLTEVNLSEDTNFSSLFLTSWRLFFSFNSIETLIFDNISLTLIFNNNLFLGFNCGGKKPINQASIAIIMATNIMLNHSMEMPHNKQFRQSRAIF